MRWLVLLLAGCGVCTEGEIQCGGERLRCVETCRGGAWVERCLPCETSGSFAGASATSCEVTPEPWCVGK